MTTATGLLGVDPEALRELGRRVEHTASELLDRRREIERLLTDTGMAPAVTRRMVEVEEWLADIAADLRRRAQVAMAPAATPSAGALSTACARLVAVDVGKAHFQP